MWDLVSRPTIKPRPPALGPQSLGHWTIREVPMHLFYWCIGYISRSRICGSNVYTVRILGTQYTEVASRKELTYQQLGNKLLSLLFCPSDKQNCSFVLHFVDFLLLFIFIFDFSAQSYAFFTIRRNLQPIIIVFLWFSGLF